MRYLKIFESFEWWKETNEYKDIIDVLQGTIDDFNIEVVILDERTLSELIGEIKIGFDRLEKIGYKTTRISPFEFRVYLG